MSDVVASAPDAPGFTGQAAFSNDAAQAAFAVVSAAGSVGGDDRRGGTGAGLAPSPAGALPWAAASSRPGPAAAAKHSPALPLPPATSFNAGFQAGAPKAGPSAGGPSAARGGAGGVGPWQAFTRNPTKHFREAAPAGGPVPPPAATARHAVATGAALGRSAPSSRSPMLGAQAAPVPPPRLRQSVAPQPLHAQPQKASDDALGSGWSGPGVPGATPGGASGSGGGGRSATSERGPGELVARKPLFGAQVGVKRPAEAVFVARSVPPPYQRNFQKQPLHQPAVQPQGAWQPAAAARAKLTVPLQQHTPHHQPAPRPPPPRRFSDD